MKNPSLNKFYQFFSKYKPLNFKKGETLLRAGDPILGVYLLNRGFVRLFTVSSSGEELTLIIFKKGDLFPITWALTQDKVLNTQQDYYLEAMSPSELIRSPREEFLKFIRSDPEALFELTGGLSKRFGGLLIRIESLVFGEAYSRIASILLLCAERFGRKVNTQIEIEVPLTHSDVASLIGVARETVSIELKKLEKMGLIGYRGRLLVIKNLRRLRREALPSS